MTTKQALELFLIHLAAIGMRAATVDLRRKQLARFARQVPGLLIADIDQETVEAWLAVQDWAPATRRSHLAALRTFFKWCVRRGYLTESPVEDIAQGPMPRPNPRPVDDEAYAFALAVADPRERLLLRLAAEAGLRRAEVAKVHARDIFRDLDGWSLIVQGKGGHVRYVPLKDDLARALRACGEGYIFPGNEDGHLSAAHVGVLVRRLLPVHFTMHKLRTRFGTRAYAATRDLRAVQELLGHASPATTQAYIQVPREAMRAAVEAV